MRASRFVRAGTIPPLLLAVSTGCTDARDVTEPSTGTIRVSLTTSGVDVDPLGGIGYRVSVDRRVWQARGVDGATQLKTSEFGKAMVENM
jgi:hypothetical protein